MFLSTTTNNRDAKGRVSVPADFRAVITAQSIGKDGAFDGIIVRPSFSGECLEGGGEQLFEAYRASINALDYFDPNREAMEQAIFGESRRLPFDSGGRVSLPHELADMFGFNGRVTFVGLGDRFEIWPPEAHELRVIELRKRASENRQLLRPVLPQVKS